MHPAVSVNTESTIDASKKCNVEKIEEIITGAPSDLTEERIRANLEPLNAQISTLIQLLNHLTSNCLAKTNPTTSTHRPQIEPSLSRETGTSRNLTGAIIRGTGLSTDNDHLRKITQ